MASSWFVLHSTRPVARVERSEARDAEVERAHPNECLQRTPCRSVDVPSQDVVISGTGPRVQYPDQEPLVSLRSTRATRYWVPTSMPFTSSQSASESSASRQGIRM